MGSHSVHNGPDPNARIEMRDADLGIVAKAMAGTMLGLFVCMGIGLFHFRWEQAQNTPKPADVGIFKTVGRVPPGPRLQAFPARDLETFRAQQTAKLEGYGWVDKQGEVAHVPIAEGMDRLLKQGVAARAEGQPFKLADPQPVAGAKPAAGAVKKQ